MLCKYRALFWPTQGARKPLQGRTDQRRLQYNEYAKNRPWSQASILTWSLWCARGDLGLRFRLMSVRSNTTTSGEMIKDASLVSCTRKVTGSLLLKHITFLCGICKVAKLVDRISPWLILYHKFEIILDLAQLTGSFQQRAMINEESLHRPHRRYTFDTVLQIFDCLHAFWNFFWTLNNYRKQSSLTLQWLLANLREC